MKSNSSAPKTLAFTFAVLLVAATSSSAADSSSEPNGPLIVDLKSHVIVMEYEAWFGPEAVAFQGTAAMPLLQSSDMQSVGGGYDSADPAVIQRHVAQFEQLGIDAAIADLTNNVSCIFDSEWFVRRYVTDCSPSFRTYNQNIRDNTGNLFPAWTKLGTHLKLIPQLGVIDLDAADYSATRSPSSCTGHERDSRGHGNPDRYN